MSMKSFDKFCEKMILGEPGSEKEIFDERQNQLRTHILVQSLVIYAIASALCVVLNEFIGFLESDFSGMVFVAGAVYLWWVISLAVKECMFGVSGKQVLYNALTVIVLIPIYVMIILPDEDEPPFAIAINGALTEKAVVLAALLLYMIATVIILVSYYRTRHTKQ